MKLTLKIQSQPKLIGYQQTFIEDNLIIKNFYQINQKMLPNNFTNLLLALQYRKTYQKALQFGKEKFNIKQNNIEDLTPFKTLELYRNVVKKFYLSRSEIVEGSWFQNELRIYLWLLIGYLFIHKKTIEQMKIQDWQYFSPIFHNRPQILFHYQALCLNPIPRSSKWSPSEIDLLQLIIKQKKYKNKWNSIARQLFIRSEKSFYRSPKQCRQRWLNYDDPNKKKSGWDKNQDLLLLKTILKYGHRWSIAAKVLENTRTQHMVKNRFKSLIAVEIKRGKESQTAIVKKLISKIEKQLSLNEKGSVVDLNMNMTTKSSLNQSLSYEKTTNSPLPLSNEQTTPLFSNYQIAIKIGQQQEKFDEEQNQFLMSNYEIQNFMELDFPHVNKNAIEVQQQQGIQHQFGEQQQKINYFSEEYHNCFP